MIGIKFLILFSNIFKPKASFLSVSFLFIQLCHFHIRFLPYCSFLKLIFHLFHIIIGNILSNLTYFIVNIINICNYLCCIICNQYLLFLFLTIFYFLSRNINISILNIYWSVIKINLYQTFGVGGEQVKLSPLKRNAAKQEQEPPKVNSIISL